MVKKAAAGVPSLAQRANNPFAGLLGGSDLIGQVAAQVLKRGTGRKVTPLEQIDRANSPAAIPVVEKPVEAVAAPIAIQPPAPAPEPVIYPPTPPAMKIVMMGGPSVNTTELPLKTTAAFDKAAMPGQDDEKPRAHGEETNEVKFRRFLEEENQRTCLGISTFQRLLPQLLAAQYDDFVRDGGMTRNGGTGHVTKALLTATQRIFKAFPAWQEEAKFVERNGILLDGVYIDVVMSMKTAMAQVRSAKSQVGGAITDDAILAHITKMGLNVDKAAVLLNENNRCYAVSRQLTASVLWAIHTFEPDMRVAPSGP